MAVEQIRDEAVGLVDKTRHNEETAKFERLMMDDFTFFVNTAFRIIDKGNYAFANDPLIRAQFGHR